MHIWLAFFPFSSLSLSLSSFPLKRGSGEAIERRIKAGREEGRGKGALSFLLGPLILSHGKFFFLITSGEVFLTLPIALHLGRKGRGEGRGDGGVIRVWKYIYKVCTYHCYTAPHANMTHIYLYLATERTEGFGAL